MTPLIQTDIDVLRLRLIAEQWNGTPYAPNGAILGAGVSCQKLPSVILREFGHEAPEAPDRRNLAKSEIAPMMRYWLNTYSDFFAEVQGVENIRAGDVILIEAGFGHLALALDKGQAIHSWQRDGAHFTQLCEERIAKRITGIWRPIVPEFQ